MEFWATGAYSQHKFADHSKKRKLSRVRKRDVM